MQRNNITLIVFIFFSVITFWIINQQLVKYGGGIASGYLRNADIARMKNVLFYDEDTATIGKVVRASTDSSLLELSSFAGYKSTNDSISKRVITLKNQYIQAQKYKKFYVFWIKNYYAGYYANTLTVILCTLITAVLGFLIAFTGWQSATLTVKISFCCFFVCSSFFGAASLVLQQKENGAKNTVQYTKVNNLQIEIQSNLSSIVYNRLNTKHIDSVINYIGGQLQSLDLFNIDIDASQYKVENYESQLNSFSNNKRGK